MRRTGVASTLSRRHFILTTVSAARLQSAGPRSQLRRAGLMIRWLSRIPPRVLGAGVIVFVVALIVVTFTGVYRAPFSGSSRTVVAVFARAPQLYPGDEVRLEGRIDGHVTAIQRNRTGPGAKVTML